VFGRATIMLGISPHSSILMFFPPQDDGRSWAIHGLKSYYDGVAQEKYSNVKSRNMH